MNKSLLTFIFLVFSAGLFAQSPNAFNYQAALRDSQGAFLNNQSVGLKIEIENSTGVIYTEESVVQTNAFGIINVQVGVNPSSSSNTFADIDWSQGPYSIKTSVDPSGGQNYQFNSTSDILSVPYAKYASNVFSGDFTDLTNVPVLDSSDSNELQTLSINGNILEVSNGNSVQLPISGDNDTLNEIQSILLTPAGYLKLSKSMDSVYSYVNYDSIAFKLLQDTSFTSAFSGNGYGFECVDMGISVACYSLGIDSSITLKPNDSYTYSLSTRHTTNSSTISQQVNWRKFRLTGIDTSNFEGLVLKYKRNTGAGNQDIMVSLDPSLVNGAAYFYIYSYQSRQDKSCGTSNGGSCVYLGRLTSVPAANTWYVTVDCWTGSNSTGGNDIEILIKDGNSYKNTGVMFDISVQN
mgnify:CR=1 FL=1|jgi:hypothetical protein